MTSLRAQLEEIRRLMEGVTPGPWAAWKNYRNFHLENIRIAAPKNRHLALMHPWDEKECLADAEFIAQSRTLVPRLVDSLMVAVADAELRQQFPSMEPARPKLLLERIDAILKGEQG